MSTSVDAGKSKAKEFMETAISEINSKFGEGYAEQHPELVGSYMQTIAVYAFADCYAKLRLTTRTR